MDRAVIQLNGQPFRMSSSSGLEHLLVKWLKDIRCGLVTVHFCASREFIGNMKSE
jgi:hypothetical protein